MKRSLDRKKQKEEEEKDSLEEQIVNELSVVLKFIDSHHKISKKEKIQWLYCLQQCNDYFLGFR